MARCSPARPPDAQRPRKTRMTVPDAVSAPEEPGTAKPHQGTQASHARHQARRLDDHQGLCKCARRFVAVASPWLPQRQSRGGCWSRPTPKANSAGRRRRGAPESRRVRDRYSPPRRHEKVRWLAGRGLERMSADARQPVPADQKGGHLGGAGASPGVAPPGSSPVRWSTRSASFTIPVYQTRGVPDVTQTKTPSERGFRRWARLGSNQRPLACEASALPLSYAPGHPGRRFYATPPGRWPAGALVPRGVGPPGGGTG